MKPHTPRFALSALALGLAAVAACQPASRGPLNITADVQSRMTANLHPALRGTVGEFAALVDSAPITVEGWGIVGGLPNTGSGDMDSRIHELMMNRLLTIGIGEFSTGTQNVSPEAILASQEISVVEVRGIIPPLARKGSTFDIYVNTLPGTGTTSLANGLLWPSDLKQRGLTFNGDDTATIATGRGPVFIPGPLEAESRMANGQPAGEVRKALLSGRVIAGGVCLADRDARLQLYAPDPMMTRLVERTINAHYPSGSGREKAAVANDENTVSLHIPPEFKDNPMDFVEACRHLYLMTDQPGFVESKAHELIEALKEPGTPHRDLGLALQGLGRSILPDYIQPYYTSRDSELRFWCARAGACLQDVQGLATLQEIVRDPASPQRRQALIAMIDASRGRDTERTTLALYDMIRSYNNDDRILAYHALLAIRSRAVLSYNVGRKFMVDIIPADSPPLIYVLEADSPRIAFIGRDISLAPGATFISKDKLLSVIGDLPSDVPEAGPAPQLVPGLTPIAAAKPKEKDSVTLYYRSPLGDKTAELRTVSSIPGLVARASWIPDPLAPDYDPKAPYIGASYQRITELLAGMCADKTIDANFIVEHVPDALINPTDLALSGRPEGSTRTTTAPAPAPAPTPVVNPPATDSTVPAGDPRLDAPANMIPIPGVNPGN
jgi:flagellar basal body P-ring protein FlgI